MESKFKRPLNHTDDPEAAYRKGYQQGAIDALKAAGKGSSKPFKDWTDADLQVWKNAPDAAPLPPPTPKN